MADKPRKTGNNPAKSVTLKDVEPILEKHRLKLEKKEDHKRIYRKASELFDPDQSTQAEANRLTKSTGLRLPKGLIDEIDKIASSCGLKRTQWMARILEAAVEEKKIRSDNRPDSSPE